jgi:hypothetical protein
MLTEFKDVLSVEITLDANTLKHVFICVARQPQFFQNEPYQKNMDMSLLHFYCI